MALPTASDNPFPSLLIVEGTEPSAPAAGRQRVYIDSTSHHLSRTDSSGTQVDLETNQSSAAVVLSARAKRTAGDLTLNTTGWQDVDTGTDLTIAVATGDIIEYALSLNANSAANALAFDVATIVSASPVNYLGSAGGVGDNGPGGWYSASGVAGGVGGSVQYVIQAGDISAGNVTLRLRVRPANTTARIVSASTATPLMVSVKNLRQ